MSKTIADFMYSVDDVVKNNKIVFPGFSKKLRDKLYSIIK